MILRSINSQKMKKLSKLLIVLQHFSAFKYPYLIYKDKTRFFGSNVLGSPKVIIQQGLLHPVGAQYCDVTEWLRSVLSIWVPVSTFNSGLNAAKSTHHTQKSFKQATCLKQQEVWLLHLVIQLKKNHVWVFLLINKNVRKQTFDSLTSSHSLIHHLITHLIP